MRGSRATNSRLLALAATVAIGVLGEPSATSRSRVRKYGSRPRQPNSHQFSRTTEPTRCLPACTTSATEATVPPNPSLNRSTNGMPPAPGRRYTVHFRQPGAGTMPLLPG